MSELFTDRALEWFARIAVVLRIAMLLFIAYAISVHLGWVDADAIVMALFLIVRSMRARSDVAGDVHNINVFGGAGDPVSRARAAARAIESATKGQ